MKRNIIEGAVAAFFFDITDGANESHDHVCYPGSYVANIIETCSVLDGGWQRADGMDHLIYCFEQEVDPTVTGSGTYFPTRSVDPTDQEEWATEPSGWSQADVRTLWTCNLYGEC